MSFTDQKPFVATAEDIKRRWGGGFDCKLCGHKFTEGDTARWIYANGTKGMQTGNFFVCHQCDGSDDVLEHAKESFTQAVKLARQWHIYGPDWERDIN